MTAEWETPPTKRGVRLKAGGNLHVTDPTTIKRRTRCGIRVTAATVDDWETGVDSADVPPEARCAKCFPGTGRRS